MRLKSLYPDGACAGITEKGKKCRMRDIFQNGFCLHHGGKGTLIREEMMKAKIQRRIKKGQKKARQLDRMLNRMMKENPGLRERIEQLRRNARGVTTALPTLPELPKLADGGKPS